jgi:hypothetical protein
LSSRDSSPHAVISQQESFIIGAFATYVNPSTETGS